MRYRTLTDLLRLGTDQPAVREARGQILDDPAVRQLLERRNPAGYWGEPEEIFKWWPKKETTFWVLGVLADFGLNREDSGIERACEYVLGTQQSSGAFGLKPPSKGYDCFTGILTESLARLGYEGDERLERAYGWLVERQRDDAGFWCKETGQPGRPRQHEPSCAFAALCVLSAFSAHPKLRESDPAERTVAFLLRCWDKRGTIKYAGHDSEIGTGWEKLKYPFTDYRILHYLDTVTRVPSARKDPRVLEMTDILMGKADGEGRFQPESIHKAWSAFDFGQKKDPSRWLTFLAHRIASRTE